MFTEVASGVVFRFSVPHSRFYNIRVIVDNAIYVDGRRTGSCPFEETYETCRERGGFAWIGLYESSREEFD